MGWRQIRQGHPRAQVLGNAELRARYDAHGADALNVDFMDSADFFAALFGSDRRLIWLLLTWLHGADTRRGMLECMLSVASVRPGLSTWWVSS